MMNHKVTPLFILKLTCAIIMMSTPHSAKDIAAKIKVLWDHKSIKKICRDLATQRDRDDDFPLGENAEQLIIYVQLHFFI